MDQMIIQAESRISSLQFFLLCHIHRIHLPSNGPLDRHHHPHPPLQLHHTLRTAHQSRSAVDSAPSHISSHDDTGHPRMQLSHVRASCRGSVKLLRHCPASHDQIAYLAISESSQGQEERQGLILRIGIVLAILYRMYVHIVVPQSDSIPKWSGCQFHIRDKLASHITLSQQKATHTNRPPAVPDIGKLANSITSFEILACKFQRQLSLSFEPLVIANRAAFSLSDSGIVYAASPIVLAELPISKEEIAIPIVVTRSVPILEGKLANLWVETLAYESAVAPDLVHCVPSHREIISILLLLLLQFIKCKLTAGIYLMRPEDDALPTLL